MNPLSKLIFFEIPDKPPCYIQVPEQFKSSKLINCRNKSKSYLFFVRFIVVSLHRVQVSRTTSHTDLNPDLFKTTSFYPSQQLHVQLYCCFNTLLTSVICYKKFYSQCNQYMYARKAVYNTFGEQKTNI